MNKGFFSAIVALLVLSVAFSVILSSPVYKKTMDVPIESRIAPQKMYIWTGTDQATAQFMSELESTRSNCSSDFSQLEVTNLNRAVNNKLQSLSESLGMKCALSRSPSVVRSGIEFSYTYRCRLGTSYFTDTLKEKYLLQNNADMTGCLFIDQYLN